MLNKTYTFVKGTPEVADQVNTNFDELFDFLNTAIIIGDATPEGVIVASKATIYENNSPDGDSKVYIKQTSSGSTGWSSIALQSELDTEVTRANLAEGVLQGHIDNNTSAIIILQGSINDEILRAQNSESNISDSVSNETNRAEIAEDGLSDRIDSVEGSITYLNQYCLDEVTRAEGVEGTLQSNINDEAAARTHLILRVLTKDNDFEETLTYGTTVILCDATSNDIDIKLPTPVSNTAQITVKKIDSSVNVVNIIPNDTETIDGQSSKSISTQYEYFRFISDGVNWYIV